jgi:hypothetical protein
LKRHFDLLDNEDITHFLSSAFLIFNKFQDLENIVWLLDKIILKDRLLPPKLFYLYISDNFNLDIFENLSGRMIKQITDENLVSTGIFPIINNKKEKDYNNKE